MNFDFQKMMKQAQKMQDQMNSIQQELETIQVTGTAGNGAVTIVLTGKYDPVSVSIKQEAMEDREMLEDLVLAALKDSSDKVAETAEKKMSALTAGLNIPGLKIPGF